MGTTQPIRDKDELKNFIAYYEVAHPNIRNYTMIILGLYTALRISDVLNLKWKDVYYFEKDCFLDHLLIHEQKTGKVNEIALNSHVIKALDCYRKTRKPDAEDYIFSKQTNPTQPLCRSQAYRIVRRAADETLCETHISCHSLRKTFGYHAWNSRIRYRRTLEIQRKSEWQADTWHGRREIKLAAADSGMADGDVRQQGIYVTLKK